MQRVQVTQVVVAVGQRRAGGEGHEYEGWTNLNQWMCEHGHAVGYWGQNKDDVKGEHWKNREYLAGTGEQELLEWDND